MWSVPSAICVWLLIKIIDLELLIQIQNFEIDHGESLIDDAIVGAINSVSYRHEQFERRDQKLRSERERAASALRDRWASTFGLKQPPPCRLKGDESSGRRAVWQLPGALGRRPCQRADTLQRLIALASNSPYHHIASPDWIHFAVNQAMCGNRRDCH